MYLATCRIPLFHCMRFAVLDFSVPSSPLLSSPPQYSMSYSAALPFEDTTRYYSTVQYSTVEEQDTGTVMSLKASKLVRPENMRACPPRMIVRLWPARVDRKGCGARRSSWEAVSAPCCWVLSAHGVLSDQWHTA